jgi:uncharacterized phiE125 gp8 family phage protein
MMLSEVTTVPDAALPMAEFKAHLRLGTGFGEDTLQDAVLVGFLRAAIGAIEARTAKVLIERSFSWLLNAWRNPEAEVLPVAPVNTVNAVTLSDVQGAQTVLDPGTWRLEQDTQSPRLRPTGYALATIPEGGSVRIDFDAGMAPDWGGLPGDLGQAVLLLAAHYYEYRAETGLADGCMPFGVTSLLQRYRAMRITPGVKIGLVR